MRISHDFDDYKNYEPSESCYLDGRYFNMVLAPYPGLVDKPLYVRIGKMMNDEGELEEFEQVYMEKAEIDNRYPNIIRVIIETPEHKHSNLLVVDFKERDIIRYEPKTTKYDDDIDRLIQKYFSMYGNFNYEKLEFETPNVKNKNCEVSGYCNAYVTKLAYDYVNRRNFDPSDIRRFVSRVEAAFDPLPYKGRDIEYGPFDGGRGQATLIGGLGGLAIGGALGGGTGAILGGGLGALGGNLLSR